MEKALYSRIKNPLSNERFVKDALYEYIYNESLFNGLFKNNKTNNNQSLIFHDMLYKSNYDDWKKEIDELYESTSEDDYQYEDIKTIYEFLNNYHVKSYKDVSNVLTGGYQELGDLFVKYCPFSFDDDGFITINTFKKTKFDNGLCINCDLSKMHFLLYKFYEKCQENNLDYCIKFDESGLRKDSIIIYSDSQNYPVYLKILEDIISENDLNYSLDDLPLCIGEISPKIGYISGKDDFSSRRVRHIERCIEQETMVWMNNYFDKNITTFTGREVPYKNYLFSKFVIEKRHKLLDDYSTEFKTEVINSKDFTKVLTDTLIRNYKYICEAVYNRDYNYTLTVPYKNKTVEFTYYDFANLLKEQANFFRKQPGFEDSILWRIKNTSVGWDVDPANYGMDIGDAYLLGKDMNVPKRKVTLEMLDNFDDSKRKVRGSREGRILDSNIKKKNRFSDILSKEKNKK